MVHHNYSNNVFVNCPFDSEYEPILQAVLFCLVRFGLTPRIATERNDGAETRIDKIRELIECSKYSVHDLSRCQARVVGEHYRLNMPFELGMDFGCKFFGGEPHDQKVILILEEERYRYQAALSDLAGSDISYHEANYELAVRKVRNWITSFGGFEIVGASKILSEYEDFQEWYIERQIAAGFSEDDALDFTTSELLEAMQIWVAEGRPRE